MQGSESQVVRAGQANLPGNKQKIQMTHNPYGRTLRAIVRENLLDHPQVELARLGTEHPGLTNVIAAFYAEAAEVCLSRHHAPPRGVKVETARGDAKFVLLWNAPDDRTRNAWANEIDATEAGACGVCLLAVELNLGLVAIMRAETATGADYYVAPVGAPLDDIENAYRLEISGVDRGNAAAVHRRLTEKVAQARRGKSNRPALASVCGFQLGLVAVSDVIFP